MMKKIHYLIVLFLVSCNPIYTKITKEKIISEKLILGHAGNTSGFYRDIGYYVEFETNDSLVKWEHLFTNPDSVLSNNSLVVAENDKKYFVYIKETGYYYRIPKKSNRRFDKIYEDLNIPDSLNWKKK